MKPEHKHLLNSWREEFQKMYHTHYSMSVKIRRLNYLLGVPLILLLFIIAVYLFLSVAYAPPFWAKVTVGAGALLAALLATLQTFLKYSEQAENHRNASARYQALFNSFEQLLALPPENENVLGKVCDRLRERWDELNLEAPSIPEKLESKPPRPRKIPAHQEPPATPFQNEESHL